MLRPRRCAAVLAIWAILAIQARINGEILNSSDKTDGVTRSDATVDRIKPSPHGNEVEPISVGGERDTLIESGESGLSKKSLVEDKGKTTHSYIDVGGVKNLEYSSARAKKRVTVINNVKSEILEGPDEKHGLLRNLKTPEESRDGKDFVTTLTKARIFPDGQATKESFDDSKDERNIESGSYGASGNSAGAESTGYSTSTDLETSLDEVGDPFFVENPDHPIPRDDGKSIGALKKTRFNSEWIRGRGDSNFGISPTPEHEMEEPQSPEGDAVENAPAYPNSVETRDNAVRQIGLSQGTEIGRVQSTPQTEAPAILSEAPGAGGDPEARLISDESFNHHPRGEIYGIVGETRPNEYLNRGELNEVKKLREPIFGTGNGSETRKMESLTPDIADLVSRNSSDGVEDRSTRIGTENYSSNQSGGDTVMTESPRAGGNDDAKEETTLDPPEVSGPVVFLGGIEEVVSEKKFTSESSETGTLGEKVNRGENSMSSVNKIEDDKNVKAEYTSEANDTGNRESDVNAVENRAPTTGRSVQNGVTEGLDFTVNLLGGKNNDGDLRGREKGRVSRTAGGNKNNTSESETEFVKLSTIDIPRYESLTGSYSDAEGKTDDRGAELSEKIVPNFVGDDQKPLDVAPRNHREENSLKYSNNAEAITAIPPRARLSDKYLWSKNKRGMNIVGQKPIRKLGGVEESTVTSVPDTEDEAEESPNVSSLIATSKTDTGSTFYPVEYTAGGEEPMGKVWDENSAHLSRAFTSPRGVGTGSKGLSQSEQLFPEDDVGEGENLTGMNFLNQNKSPENKNRAASDDPRMAITGGGDQTYPDNGNEGSNSANRDVASASGGDRLSTETNVGIFQAFTQGLSPSINFNPADSENVSRGSTPSNQWPVKHSAVVEGDLVLGGLMMVHEREDTVTCGPVMPQGGVQALEAMLYTLDWFNEKDIIPGVKIGAHILDDCDKDTYGLEMAVDFIKGSISNIDGAEYHCNKTAVRKVISGVVGAASSVTSIQVANLLRLFRIPQVSFFSTSPELSNKQRFEYFTRTIPSDHYQVKAMVDIIRKMNWSYVSIVYEESNYGIKAFEELEALFIQNNICIAIKEKLVKDSGVAQENSYDIIVQKLLTKPRARGCIIYGSDQEVAGLMRAVGRNNATGAFSWIGSDGWSARGLVSDGNEPVVEGTLSVQPQANPVKGFEEYFLDLTVENNRRNPWFVEFWENHFQCRYPNASLTPHNVNYTEPCTTKERLMKNDTAFENQLQFVSDAVMAFAYAFRNMHRDLCPEGKRGLCDAMKPIKGTELLKYLKNVTFEGLSGDEFRFDKNGDGPARYNIFNFKQVSPGKYKWVRVGEYMEGELRLNMSEIKFRMGQPTPPESVCSLPCEVGQAKKYVEGESCCWHCFNCTQYQIRHQQDEKQCEDCPQGTLPDDTHSECHPIPEEFLRPESGWAIGAMSFSATGILVTLFIGGVFLKHDDTPVVRASGRESSYVLLTGILLCYLITFALVLRPNDIVCGIQRFGAGFCFTVVYAALLTKTNRISRIFNAGRQSAQRPPFTSPRSQLIICSGLVGVQILVNGVWMIIDPARAMHHYPTKEDNLLVCNSYIDASYMIAFAYPIILIVVCTVYAVLTRKIPEDYNESKHIGFTMYTTCVIWLAFVPLYFGTGNHVALRITSMSVTISLSASVTIACLFSPKLYIILIHPERNVRQSMMQGRYSTTNNSNVTGTNASCMMAPLTVCAVTSDQNKAVKRYVTTTIDGSTQSDEHYEMEVKEDRSNGKAPGKFISRSTQASATEPELKSTRCTKDVIATSKDIATDNGAQDNKQTNNARIGNGPMSQKDVPL